MDGAHFFRFEQLFRMMKWRIIREWLGSSHGNDYWNVEKEAFVTLLRNSQYHYPVLGKTSTEINGVKCLQLRLDDSSAKNIFGSPFILVLS